MNNKLVKSKTGRTLTMLNEDLKKDILDLVKIGKSNNEISNDLGISYKNLLNWKEHFISEWNNADMSYQLSLAEAFSKSLLNEKAGKKDTSLKAIQQKEAEFLRKQLISAKSKYNDTPQVAIQVNFPSPIVDLGKLDSQ